MCGLSQEIESEAGNREIVCRDIWCLSRGRIALPNPKFYPATISKRGHQAAEPRRQQSSEPFKAVGQEAKWVFYMSGNAHHNPLDLRFCLDCERVYQNSKLHFNSCPACTSHAYLPLSFFIHRKKRKRSCQQNKMPPKKPRI